MTQPLESFLESFPDAFIAFAPSGRIAMVNRPALELLGYERADLVGQSIELVLPALKAQGVELTLTTIEAGDGTLIMGRLASRGEHGGSPGNAHPTEQGTLLMDEFLATLAHELRTPLHSMLGWTQLMRSAPRDQEMTARAVEIIERNIRWQAQAIDDLLDLAEILFGQLRLEVRPVRVTPIIDSALERASDTARSKGIRLARSLDAAEAEILADPVRLEHVLWKLLSNALRFTPEGGQVEVRSQEVGSLVRITVSDTGQGIDPDLLPRIFDRVRPPEQSSRSHERSGLGLSIVRSLVEMQGGSVRAESEGQGRGASFVVSLPLVRGSSAPS